MEDKKGVNNVTKMIMIPYEKYKMLMKNSKVVDSQWRDYQVLPSDSAFCGKVETSNHHNGKAEEQGSSGKYKQIATKEGSGSEVIAMREESKQISTPASPPPPPPGEPITNVRVEPREGIDQWSVMWQNL